MSPHHSTQTLASYFKPHFHRRNVNSYDSGFHRCLDSSPSSTPAQSNLCPELNLQITLSNGIRGAVFDCAHLEVPLDYTNSSSPPLELSLFKVNATQEAHLGSVLINFGGPGGTGAQNLPHYSGQMAANIGAQWDLVSWDPRGTEKTIPFNCGDISPALSGGKSQQERSEPRLASVGLTDYFLRVG
jgi:hypothetical protein